MTLYNSTSYALWYLKLRHRVKERAHFKCEIPGCNAWADQVHHLVYPTGRREDMRDLMAVCARHHYEMHNRRPANDNKEDEQLELNVAQRRR
jgi:hypothetical protein